MAMCICMVICDVKYSSVRLGIHQCGKVHILVAKGPSPRCHERKKDKRKQKMSGKSSMCTGRILNNRRIYLKIIEKYALVGIQNVETKLCILSCEKN